MPDSYVHKFNAQQALRIASYIPRNYHAFILGSNGPDPLFSYRMYNPFRRFNLFKLGTVMHNEKTGLFLQNLFRYAQTDAQKDYCLGFLCHYSLDSTFHPYINYITTAYGHPFNMQHGHGYFESALDSFLSHHETGKWAASPNEYCPDMKKIYLDQIITLFKQATEATYPDVFYDREEYAQAFSDFRTIKYLLWSPKGFKVPLARIAEKVLGLGKGFIVSHMQPCTKEIQEISVWRNNPMGFFCTATIKELLSKASQQSADYVQVGLQYFNGVYSINDLLEDIGNKSYETGIALVE